MEKSLNNNPKACINCFRMPELLTEEELVIFLRIPEVSKAKNYHNVIENLKRMHDLPRIHICGKPLYPIEAIRKWIQEKTIFEK
jgi:hypothetical protein